VWKSFFVFILFFVWGVSAKAQVFTQTFVDRCTGEVKTVTANFSSGPTTVAFYNRVRVFTPQEATNGTLQQWLIETYNWWNSLSPCSQAATQTQQATQQATQAVTNVTNVLSSPPPSNTNTNTSASTQTETSTNVESSTTETKSEETVSSESDSGDEGSSSDEENDDSDGGGGKGVTPIIVSGDIMGMQSLQGSYNSVLSMGISKSSIYGDESYMGNLMIWDNLRQFSIGGNMTKMFLSNTFELDFIESYSLNYTYSFGVSSVSAGYSTIKTFDKWGTFGGGINYSIIFGRGFDGTITTFAYNFLYTKSFKVNRQLIYTPAIVYTTSPIGYLSSVSSTYISKDKMFVISNGIDYQISRRFKFNINWTPILNTNKDIPMINMFMVGSKIRL
jgi:hypothetical protein